jgi:hypothetical protein
LKRYERKEWLSLHKWILVLLLAQAFLDDPFALLQFMFQEKIFVVLSEVGKVTKHYKLSTK